MSRRKLLLENIKLLGGDKTDLDLIENVLSDGEGEVDLPNVSVKCSVSDESSLAKDLLSFYNQLGIAGMANVDDSEEEEVVKVAQVPKMTAKEKKKLKKGLQKSAEPSIPTIDLSIISEEFLMNEGGDDYELELDKSHEDTVREMVGQLLCGNIPAAQNKMVFELNDLLWYQAELEPIVPATIDPAKNSKQSIEKVKQMHAKAELLWKADVSKYEQKRGIESKANKDFVSTILNNGTVTDKVSALTLLIQESPIHTHEYLSENLINGMARKRSRREAIMAVDSIKDLMINNILPDRKLK